MGTGLTQSWAVEEQVGRAADLFSAESWLDVAEPTARVLKVSAPTIVLGSSQSLDVVELADCAAGGVDVVRRRSGGGAVWLDDDMVWVDVFVPVGHARWDADIGRSMWWLGQAWAEALHEVGVADVVVHRDAMVRTRWSSLVCFAGLGAGEVTLEGRKIVGISQRRSRAGALFQCGVLRRWHPDRLVDALAGLDQLDRVALRRVVADAGVGIGDRAALALRAFLRALATGVTSPTPNLSDR